MDVMVDFSRLVFALGLAAMYGAVRGTATIHPYLSSGDGPTVLAFLDVHRHHHDNGTCSDPDWAAFELAHGLLLETQHNNTTGIEVYDTCGSVVRVLAILRQRLFYYGCTNVSTSPVSGVMSHTTTAISDVIGDAIRVSGVMYVDVRGVPAPDPKSVLPPQHLVLPLASRNYISALVHMMEILKWRYVTTVTDDDPESVFEHMTFVQEARARGICVLYSQTPESPTQLHYSNVKTPGVVIFTQDVMTENPVLNNISDTVTVIIVTHNKRVSTHSFIKNGLVFSDTYDNNETVIHSLMDEVKSNTIVKDMVWEYYATNHNCSRNESTGVVACPDIRGMDSVASDRSSSMLLGVFRLLASFTDHMRRSNCTSFSIEDCAMLSDLLVSGFSETSTFLGTDNNELVIRPPYGVVLERINNGSSIQVDTFLTSGSSALTPDLVMWLDAGNSSFPASECTGWCPACQPCDGNLPYNGEFYHLPGDILISGLLSIRDNGGQPFTCGDFSISTNADIFSEAFIFAVQSAQQRYPDLLPGTAIGALLFDTCTDIDIARQTILNFESCQYAFESEGNSWKPNPRIVPAYVLPPDQASNEMGDEFDRLYKLSLDVDGGGSIRTHGAVLYDTTTFNHEPLVQFLQEMDWYFVGIVTSSSFEDSIINAFSEYGLSRNICVAYHTNISSNTDDIQRSIEEIRRSAANTVILIATSEELNSFFRTLTFHPIYRTWIIVETRNHWLDRQLISPPLGTLMFQRQGKENSEFNEHYKAIKAGGADAGTPWMTSFTDAVSRCVSCGARVKSTDAWMKASDIIKAVDMSLHAIHRAYTKLCPGAYGLCPAFLANGTLAVLEEIDNIGFVYQGEIIQLSPPDQMLENYAISNLQTSGDIICGEWKQKSLTVHKDKIKMYGSDGRALRRQRESYCYSDCVCINNNTLDNQTMKAAAKELDPEMGYVASSGSFTTELWSIIVVVVAGSGGLGTILLVIYIICKVCSGALIRRYLVLGLMLLVAMMFLFLSALPFVFTPSETVCGLRYFAHGCSYALCFAIILTKMITLRDYKYIGLGGEVSRLNQFLSVFFITSVQLAIGVQWWVLRHPVLFVETILEVSGDSAQEITYYACDFDRKDFIAYHVYVMLLIVICCVYSIGIRKEKKNMKEARLLLVCSWFCLAVWIALIVTLLVLSRDFLEAICAVAILANALAMMVIIYLPKLTTIAALKYEITDKMGRKDGGYQIDPDFRFERPYSLPGTMNSTVTDKTLTYPRSLGTFDTSLSY